MSKQQVCATLHADDVGIVLRARTSLADSIGKEDSQDDDSHSSSVRSI